MKNNDIDVKSLINDYNNGLAIIKIATKYHIGKIKVKDILSQNNIEVRDKNKIKNINNRYIVSDWKIEKYPPVEGFHYIAKSKDGKVEYNDYMNQGGFLTTYIKKEYNIKIPTLYDRRKYYMKTGDYWWEQWFDILLIEDKPTKKCPYCEWETIDVENKSGVFEQHLKEKHNINKNTYLDKFPEDRDYFVLANKTLDRQMSKNPDEYVVCAICGEKFARIDWRHLRKHNMCKRDYIKKYNNNLVSNKLSKRLSNIAIETNKNMEPTLHSKYELELIEFIKNYGLECKSDRKILNGKELDIFIPLKNIAIEFNGNKYHTEWFGGKTRQYHLKKTKQCKEKGISLIHIFEDEFVNNKEIVFNKLGHIIGLQKELPKIYGRKCFIKQVNKDIANNFLTKYNIQEYKPSTKHYGAYYNEQLIAVMCFKIKEFNNNWEMTSFASDYNYICCGVGGKLFKHFIREYNPTIVETFADRRWTIDEENNLYLQLGFEFDGYTPPDYTYYNPKIDKYKRFHKFGFRKKLLLKKYPDKLTLEMTETEMVKKLGYDRIWDCGLIKYVWRK